jgi:hypothetical protein
MSVQEIPSLAVLLLCILALFALPLSFLRIPDPHLQIADFLKTSSDPYALFRWGRSLIDSDIAKIEVGQGLLQSIQAELNRLKPVYTSDIATDGARKVKEHYRKLEMVSSFLTKNVCVWVKHLTISDIEGHVEYRIITTFAQRHQATVDYARTECNKAIHARQCLAALTDAQSQDVARAAEAAALANLRSWCQRLYEEMSEMRRLARQLDECATRLDIDSGGSETITEIESLLERVKQLAHSGW